MKIRKIKIGELLMRNNNKYFICIISLLMIGIVSVLYLMLTGLNNMSTTGSINNTGDPDNARSKNGFPYVTYADGTYPEENPNNPGNIDDNVSNKTSKTGNNQNNKNTNGNTSYGNNETVTPTPHVKTPEVPPPSFRPADPEEVVNNKPNKYKDYTQQTTILSGISWSDDQVIPIFASPSASLDFIHRDDFNDADDRNTFAVLQGIVNKEKPRIVIFDMHHWLQDFNLFSRAGSWYNKDTRYNLILKYKSKIKGIVLYDSKKNLHYRNLAATIANINDGFIPVTEDVRSELASKGIEFSGKEVIDITKLAYTETRDIYNYLYNEYWSKCSKRLIILQDPSNKDKMVPLKDLAVASKAAILHFSEMSYIEDRDLFEKFLKDMAAEDSTSIVIGWAQSERTTVAACSKYGIGFVPGDFYHDASIYGGMDHTIKTPVIPARPDLENKMYIALFMTDGDNIQMAQRSLRQQFDEDRPYRGKIAINWTLPPLLADIGPQIMNYYYNNATSNDCFVSGPSGIGYVAPYFSGPQSWMQRGNYLINPKQADKYTKLTETYLQRTGLRVITIWEGASNMVRSSYEQNCRSLYGLTVHDWENKDYPETSSGTVNNRLRFERTVTPYAGDTDYLYPKVDEKIKAWDGSKPQFFAYEVDNNKVKINTEELYKMAAALKNANRDKNIEFVRADHYFSYYNEYNNLPFNLNMLSSTTVTASDTATSPKNVMDGSNRTMWTSSKEGNRYLEFDFGKSYSVNRYVIRHAETSGMYKNYNTRSWMVEVSTDGSTWKKVDTYKSNLSAVTDIEIPSVMARYVRITITDSGDIGTARVVDVEIYGNKI